MAIADGIVAGMDMPGGDQLRVSESPRLIQPWSGNGLDIVTLRLFKAAVEERSLNGASEREHLALSSVSRRITELEARVGTALLRRHDRGVEPTPAGEVLMKHLYIFFDVIKHMTHDLNAFASGLRGLIRFHTCLSALAGPLPEMLASFQASHPEVEILLEESISVDIIHAVQIGTADIGLISSTVAHSGVELVPWRDDHLMVVSSKTHPFAASDEPMRFDAILSEPFVGMEAAMALQSMYRSQAAKLGKTLRERVNVASFDGVRRMVEAGFGVAILPEDAAKPFTQVMGLHARALDEPWAERSLALCFRSEGGLGTAGRLLVEHLANTERRPV